MDTKILKDIGLTQSEIKVYTTLLQLGSTTVGRVLEKSGLQNSVIHRALNSLIEKGIISYILEGKRKTYQATSPENLLNYLEEKKEKLEEIIPELKKRQNISQKESATVYKGTRGIREVYRILREIKAKEYLSFGGGKVCEEKMGTLWWESHHTKRIANKLSSRQVFDETVKGFGKGLTKKPLSKIRYLPADFAQFQETVIVGDFVAITIFTDNAYSVLIEDKIVAQGYKKYFEVLWKSAKNSSSPAPNTYD